MTLSSVQLTGLLFRPVADANGAAGSFSYTRQRRQRRHR